MLFFSFKLPFYTSYSTIFVIYTEEIGIDLCDVENNGTFQTTLSGKGITFGNNVSASSAGIWNDNGSIISGHAFLKFENSGNSNNFSDPLKIRIT